MDLFRMSGKWGLLPAHLYRMVVAGGLESLYARFVDEAVSPLPEKGTVVDVGCGGGEVARLLAERCPSCRVTGVDLSEDMVRFASGRNADVVNLRFRVGDALNLPFDDDTFDVATSMASIKHWPDRVRGLREMRRVLKPGGSACVLEADRECTRDAARRFVSYWRYVLPGARPLLAFYFRKFVAGQALTLARLNDLMASAGFVEVESRRGDDLPFVVARGRKR